MNRFKQLGGTIEVRKINSLTDLSTDPFEANFIVNCTGLGKEFS